jgi:hypothetical protein
MARAFGILGILVIAISAAVAATTQALAQSCSEFDEIVVNDKDPGTLQMRPYGAEVLVNSKTALRCLLPIVAAMKTRINSPLIDPRDLARFIQVTGAIRSILGNGSIAAINDFRDLDNLDVIMVLAFAARSNDQVARVNAALILSDVIDNNSICVVIDHLYDPAINAPDSRSGRLNLLGVATVVAPWAYRENFDNLKRLQDYITPVVAAESDADQTRRVLQNLAERLDFQKDTPESQKNSALPGDLRECYRYLPVWANLNGKQLIYGN